MKTTTMDMNWAPGRSAFNTIIAITMLARPRARAKQLHKTHQPLSRLQRWALQLERRAGHNKATVALANKLAPVCWAVWKHDTDFNPEHITA